MSLISNFVKILERFSSCYMRTCGQTDRQTDIAELKGEFLGTPIKELATLLSVKYLG
jgi:hypothetical protein